MPNPTITDRPALTLHRADLRGFCAGIVRAIEIVEMAIAKWGAPVRSPKHCREETNT